MSNNSIDTMTAVMTPEQVLEHWQGHRKLTRRTIEAFPEDKLFNYSIGGMRTFALLAMEMITMASPGVKGVATGKWQKMDESLPASQYPEDKKSLLKLWDQVTAEINEYWSQIPPARFQERDLAFGQYEGTIHWLLFYFIDNEIHHRAQGYVYLRSLGIEPPAFWLR